MAGVTAGLIFGLGIIASSVKFTAKRPDLLDLLDVGRVQFGALHFAEAILIPATLGLTILMGPRQRIVTVIAGACFLLKVIWLQPILNRRMNLRLEGHSLPDSYQHIAYILLSSLIVILLLFLSFSRESDSRQILKS